MSHYFIEDNTLDHKERKIKYSYAGMNFEFTTDAGVFSREHIDPATDILLGSIEPLSGSLLDLGCGYGCIGIVLAKAYSLNLTQADVNRTALELTRVNCAANGIESRIVESNCFDGVEGLFDTITLNPPIHAGKAVTYKMYESSREHLNEGGALYVVTLKKHGAQSTREKLASVFGGCETIYKKKGYYVFRCMRK